MGEDVLHEILMGYSDSFLFRTPVGSFLDLILQFQMSLSSVTVLLLVQGTRRFVHDILNLFEVLDVPNLCSSPSSDQELSLPRTPLVTD